MQCPRPSTIAWFVLCALLSAAITVATTLYLLHTDTFRIDDALDLVKFSNNPHAPVFTTAMEMDLGGWIRSTDRPAYPSGEWNEELFIELVTEIHETLLRLGALDNATISWPPHNISRSSFPADVEVDPRVISLMRRLPVAGSYGTHVTPDMNACDFLHQKGPYISRLIDERNWLYGDDGEEPKVRLAPPTAFQWLCQEEENMPKVVLDVGTNTIHKVNENYLLRDAYTEEFWYDRQKVEDYQFDYRNWPAMSAPDYLRSIIRNLREGVWLPDSFGGTGLEVLDPNERDKGRVALLSARRKLLVEVYGWPEKFREQSWKHEVQRRPELWEEDDFWMKLLD
ncbi:hypothetical protein PRZ48_010078 [Zasmidium cellare]|uniref:Uncharacterized protein n=1 Tax=Zasmidium cellare TaxID=395010 RepID=A0ABR0EDI3_ZASCE|nr:hypothetical protein PRZ48_010078 [Zasmidium cellare]